MDAEFQEAAEQWHLERLYLDLAKAKGRGLTALEKQFLQGLLCGYSPSEISARVYQGVSRNTSAVRVYLSNGIYKYLQDLLFTPLGSSEKIKNWSRVTPLLEKAGYRRETLPGRSPLTARDRGSDWEEERDISGFVGRGTELERLGSLLVSGQCRLLCVSGLMGTGKSFLLRKLALGLESQFRWVIWRSLRSGLSCAELTASIVRVMLDNQEDWSLASLFKCLRLERCLLILDGWDAVFSPRQTAGIYLEQYQAYQELLQRLSQENHQSCCVLTSREVPREIALAAAQDGRVQSFVCRGLDADAAARLLLSRHLIGTEADKRSLMRSFANNPLVLENISLVIKQRFASRITDFLASPSFGLSLMHELWDEQIARLSSGEKVVLFTLAINQALLERLGIGQEVPLVISAVEQMQALDSLERRGFLETEGGRSRVTPLLELYILSCFITEVTKGLHLSPLQIMVGHLLQKTLGLLL